MKIYLNDQLVDASEAKVSVFDHGLLYGDGIFEGIRLYNGCVFKLKEHLERLEYSAKSIMLEMPWTRQQISDAVCETCRANGLKDGYIRLVVTRGVGNLGLSIKNCDKPQLIVIADTIQLYPQEFYDNGLAIITVPTRRCNPAALPPSVKSLNYLNNILAKIEAQHLGYHEAIMLNDQGFIAECTGDNVFVIHKGELITPSASAGALKGITAILHWRLLTKLVSLAEANMTRYDVWVADELFLTGTAAEIALSSRLTPEIGNGRPGEITTKFLAFRRRVSIEGTKI